MRILITTDTYFPMINGLVTSVTNLANQLREKGHEVKILTLSVTKNSYEENNVIYIRSVGMGYIYPQGRIVIPKLKKQLKELIEWKPDIIHSQSEFSAFFLAKKIAKKLDIPIVHTYHTNYEDYTHYFSPKKSMGIKFVKKFIRKLSKHVSVMITPSEKMENILVGYQLYCPISVIPSGIDLEKYIKSSTSNWRQKVREQFDLPEDIIVLIYVGRLGKEKNVEELLDFQREASQLGTVLLIVGDGPHKKELENIARDMGIEKNVIFTGMIPQENIGHYYQAADLFVSASSSETQGLSYLEALASGIPLLCRQDLCLKNVIETGKNGWQYTDKKTFMDNLQAWKNMSDGEKQQIYYEVKDSAKKYSMETFADTIECLYQSKI